jgi:ABC-type transport system substrate-binding protein
MDADLPLNFLRTDGIAKAMANPEYDRLFAKQRTTMNPEARRKALQELNAFLREDPPAAFLVQTSGIYALQRRVQGFAWKPTYLADLTKVRIAR